MLGVKLPGYESTLVISANVCHSAWLNYGMDKTNRGDVKED